MAVLEAVRNLRRDAHVKFGVIVVAADFGVQKS